MFVNTIHGGRINVRTLPPLDTRMLDEYWAADFTPCSAAAMLGTSEESVIVAFKALDDEYAAHVALQRRLNAPVTTDAWDVL